MSPLCVVASPAMSSPSSLQSESSLCTYLLRLDSAHCPPPPPRSPLLPAISSFRAWSCPCPCLFLTTTRPYAACFTRYNATFTPGSPFRTLVWRACPGTTPAGTSANWRGTLQTPAPPWPPSATASCSVPRSAVEVVGPAQGAVVDSLRARVVATLHMQVPWWSAQLWKRDKGTGGGVGWGGVGWGGVGWGGVGVQTSVQCWQRRVRSLHASSLP
jgi:hypothetical protein